MVMQNSKTIMKLRKATVKGQTVTVPNHWRSQDVTQFFKRNEPVCPYCAMVNVNPYTHYETHHKPVKAQS